MYYEYDMRICKKMTEKKPLNAASLKNLNVRTFVALSILHYSHMALCLSPQSLRLHLSFLMRQ